MSSLVILEPLARLSRRTGDPRFAEFAFRVLESADQGGLPFLRKPVVKATEIGTGKTYQTLWCLQGILELSRVLNRSDLLEAVEAHWSNVRNHHLTPFGGPWGGIGTHKEVFNEPDYFHPGGLVETCSSATWLTLSQSLFLHTGEGKYLAEVEKTALNGILGAMDENGRDWCYFTFPNGRRNNTYHWACCKSSGALALEACSSGVLVGDQAGLLVCQWWPFQADLPGGNQLRLEMNQRSLTLYSTEKLDLRLWIPCWARTSHPSGSFVTVSASPEGFELPFDVAPEIVPFTYTLDHHGQEIVREDYAHIRMGPYLYATSKYDGYATCRTLRLPRLNPDSTLQVSEDETVHLCQAGCKPIPFEPFYRAGGRHDGAWRTSWVEVAWQ